MRREEKSVAPLITATVAPVAKMRPTTRTLHPWPWSINFAKLVSKLKYYPLYGVVDCAFICSPLQVAFPWQTGWTPTPSST